MTTNSKAFGPSHPNRPHLIHPNAGFAGEIFDLREDIQRAFGRGEKRPTANTYPEIEWLDGGAVEEDGGDMVLRGKALLQAQTFGSLTIVTGLDLVACTPGVGGNVYTAEIEEGEPLGVLGIDLTDNHLTITLADGGSTKTEIATAINDAAADTYQLIRANVTAGGGDTVSAAVASAPFTGGAGAGWQCLISGVVAPIKHTVGAGTSTANLTETAVTVTVPDLTGEATPRAALDIVQVVIKTDGIVTQPLMFALATAT